MLRTSLHQKEEEVSRGNEGQGPEGLCGIASNGFSKRGSLWEASCSTRRRTGHVPRRKSRCREKHGRGQRGVSPPFSLPGGPARPAPSLRLGFSRQLVTVSRQRPRISCLIGLLFFLTPEHSWGQSRCARVFVIECQGSRRVFQGRGASLGSREARTDDDDGVRCRHHKTR